MKNIRYVLIMTDGYRIETETFLDKEAAQDELRRQYDMHDPQYDDMEGDIDESLLEMYEQSYLGEDDAMLYTGEEVYVWKIISVI